jgi:hypothetical protein
MTTSTIIGTSQNRQMNSMMLSCSQMTTLNALSATQLRCWSSDLIGELQRFSLRTCASLISQRRLNILSLWAWRLPLHAEVISAVGFDHFRRQMIDRPGQLDAVIGYLPSGVHGAGVDENVHSGIAAEHLSRQVAPCERCPSSTLPDLPFWGWPILSASGVRRTQCEHAVNACFRKRRASREDQRASIKLPMPKPWMIYGANGYTGELIAREAVK